ncbi:MAG: hypothetical protein Q8P77_03655 [Candidatus Veblenbacteria bacterium]|nr:hypothetical protein [Candidatus Veblenbacteria bacterium]
MNKTNLPANHINPEIIQKGNLNAHNTLGFAKVENIFSASSAKNKCATKIPTKHGTIIIATIKHGFARNGMDITVSTGNNTPLITDQIARLELNGKEIETANIGEKVGICLVNTRLRKIKRVLTRMAMGS